jgi:hypothetical protein
VQSTVSRCANAPRALSNSRNGRNWSVDRSVHFNHPSFDTLTTLRLKLGEFVGQGATSSSYVIGGSLNIWVTDLMGFLATCNDLRRSWELRSHRELWFRAEDATHHQTRLQPGLYRPPETSKRRKPVQHLLHVENRMYEEFERCGTQLSPSDGDSIDGRMDLLFSNAAARGTDEDS